MPLDSGPSSGPGGSPPRGRGVGSAIRVVADHRENNFDAARLALATLVIFSHSFDLLGLPNRMTIATDGQTDLASTAVDLFFVISGYLIVQSFVASRTLPVYLLKRVLRIYPAFIVAGVLCLVVFGPLPMGYTRAYWDQIELPTFAFRLATLQTLWVPESFAANRFPYVNAAIWTIQFEFVCYLVVAILGVAGLLRRRGVVLAMVAMTIGAHVLNNYFADDLFTRFPTSRVFTYEEWIVGGSPAYYPRFFTYFGAGLVCWLWRDRIRYTAAGAGIAAVALALALFAVRGYDLVMPIAGTYLVFWFAFNRAIPLQRVAKHGDVSYGLYVYGWPVQQTVIWMSGGHLHPLVLFAASVTGALGLAVASWVLVERPFLRLKARPAG